jgi:ribosome-associated protein
MKNESKKKALDIAFFVDEKKAEDIRILDVKDKSGLCDYFVICSAASSRQVNALALDIIKEFRKSGKEAQHCEKDETFRWVLVDFVDVILHIFLDEARSFYNLEYLWADAKKIPLPKNRK